MNLTIKDIAKMAGVSVATVSRVINKSKPVNSEIKEKVERVIRETQFRPNALARGLISKSTNLIGVIFPQINYTSAELINGIEEVANRNGYNIILSNTRLDPEMELKSLEIFRDKQVDGIILSAIHTTERHVKLIKENKIPVVVVGQKMSEHHIPWVDVDNYAPVTEMVRYLVRCGHEKIGMIHGPLHDQSAGYSRYKGFIDEMNRQGLPVNRDYLIESNFSSRDGYEAMEILLRKMDLPTAIVCASDTIAIGSKNCAEDRGYRVPDDFSIAGFDDIELATLVRPQLTTVRVDFESMGSIAMEALLHNIAQPGAETLEHYVDYRLSLRDSVKKLV
ncbi:LacI family DNA-binding transcriptional regulator [Bacillus infantis]|uniref:LacI family DNA-binding transcriptional regulator n=1 Tax=Bacillus infantis TaxID=324767 RepID=UPI003CE95D7D